MRCFIGNLTTDKCEVAVVQCSKQIICCTAINFAHFVVTEYLQNSIEYSYNGQVHLNGINHYRGIAEVRVSNTFYRLCWDTFDAYTATSICRQLGYTTGSYYRVLK